MKAETRFRYSIVIPCYNEAAYLGDTLESLQRLTFRGRYEIIVVDNASSDGSAAIAKSYGVRVVREQRPGVCWARQAGTAAARGDIVISTDADTVFATDWLTAIDEAFARHPQAVAVAGPCAYRDGPWWGRTYPRLLFGAVSRYAARIGHPFYVTATNIAFRKDAWDGYDVYAPQGGDELGLLKQLRQHGEVAFMNDNPVYTSGRRLKRGLIYNLFVTFIYYYLLGYALDRIFRRTLIGSAPAYRFEANDKAPTKGLSLRDRMSAFANRLSD